MWMHINCNRNESWVEEKVTLYNKNNHFFCEKPGYKSLDCYARRTDETQQANSAHV